MAELIDEYKRLKAMVQGAMRKKDFAALHKKIHIIDHEKERAERRQNTRGSTRVIIDCKTPEAYKQLRVELDRFFDVAVDPHIAVHMISAALHLVTTGILQAWIATGYAPTMDLKDIPVEKKAGPAPPRSEMPNVPDWLK